MKSFILTCMLLATSFAFASDESERVFRAEIHAQHLKNWYDHQKDMIVLDARSKEYFDGNLLPGAMWLPSESSEETIQSALPSKDSLIVVYCLNDKCPASGWLVDKLTAMGYTKVYECPEGIEDWMKRGYPITKQQ